jgi:Condensation domain
VAADAAGSPTPRMRASIPASRPAGGPAAPAPTLRIPVAFTGTGAGTGELSWGQREIWSAMTRQGWLCLGAARPLPPGTALPDLLAGLRGAMARYPSMRTRLRFDAEDRPTQELFGSGEIPVEIFDADGALGPGETAAAVEARYRGAERDFAGEWPVRIGVVRRHGRPTHWIVISCHLVTDGAGLELMIRDGQEQAQIGAWSSEPAPGVQQLEQARWQHSPAGRRHSAASLRYWEKMLETVPARALPASADPREPRHWTGTLHSPALYAAVPAIVGRTRADSSSVFLALYAIALGRLMDLRPAAVWTLVNNRFRPGLADVVCNLVQSGICVLDLADVPVDEAVGRAWRATMAAYKYAYYDSEKHAAMIGRMARSQGPETGLACFFNDRRPVAGRQLAGPPAGPDRLRHAVDRGSFSWGEKKDNPYERLFLNVEDAPGAVRITVSADTRCFAPKDIEALAREMETVAVQAVLASCPAQMRTG